MLPRERTKFLHLSVTPTEWLPHRREEHSPALVELTYISARLGAGVLHSAIVTDFAMERLPDSHSAVPKIVSVSK